MKKLIALMVFLIPLIFFISCGSTELRGKYANVWSYHQKDDARSTYDFKSRGVVVQELSIKPNKKLNFKGVNDTVKGTWEMEDNTIIITLPEGSYEMELVEKGKNYIILSMPARDGSILERKFVKE